MREIKWQMREMSTLEQMRESFAHCGAILPTHVAVTQFLLLDRYYISMVRCENPPFGGGGELHAKTSRGGGRLLPHYALWTHVSCLQF